MEAKEKCKRARLISVLGRQLYKYDVTTLIQNLGYGGVGSIKNMVDFKNKF